MLPSQTPSLPWLWRLHTWWFAGQVLANLVAAGFIIRLVDADAWGELGIGLLLGQGFLLSVWLALGGLPNVVRFVGVFLVTLAGGLVVSWFSLGRSDDWFIETTAIFIICFFMVLLSHGLLLPLRWLLGWRLDFDPVYHAREKTGRLQLRVMHILGWTTFVAIPCAVIRLLPGEDAADIAITCLVLWGLTMPVAAAFTMLAVGRKPIRWGLLAAVIFGLTLTAEFFLPPVIFEQNLLPFNLGIVAAVVGNLLVLRFFGLHVFSVIEPARAPAAAPISPPHFPAPVARPYAAAGS